MNISKVSLSIFLLTLFKFSNCHPKDGNKYLDICSAYNSRKLYVEYGTSGELLSDYKNQPISQKSRYRESVSQKKCSVDLITCPSCVIDIKFKFLNISRTCGKSSLFAHCGCDYILLHEPPYESASGEQFCGKYIQNNISELTYYSKTRLTTVDFVYTYDYGHAFTLQFSSKRNQIFLEGYPTSGRTNNASQIITSPFFPLQYPPDLSTEYVIICHSREPCRISLLFADFLMAHSSILEFFDFNGQRMYVISGNIFRPPVIISSGPSLIMRFYANGASDLGFKASYSFILGNFDGAAQEPNIDCGGQVNNLGGGITMMNMVSEGVKFFNCVWIVKTPTSFLHRKTHLYVKVVNFTNFAGTTELVLRQGVTSHEPAVEILKYPITRFNSVIEKEHVVPISEGFYISLRGLFRSESQLAIVYAAFNYKGLDFLCQNLRCISALLNCDGFDHCGDNSDESPDCSEDPKDHRQYSKIPNFLFPKVEPYSDLTTATFVFLVCTFGLIGIIFAMALLLYRVNVRERHQRQIQDHIETIHAILEESVGDGEEEIVLPDEPPDYEPPPEYSDVLKYVRGVTCGAKYKLKSTQRPSKSLQTTSFCTSSSSTLIVPEETNFYSVNQRVSTSRSCQTSPVNLPETPPPAYDNIQENNSDSPQFSLERSESTEIDNVPLGSSSSSNSSRFSSQRSESVNCEEIANGVISDSKETSPTQMENNVTESDDVNTIRSSLSSLSLRLNGRKWYTSVLAARSAANIGMSDEKLVRCFSDSELVFVKKVKGNDIFDLQILKKKVYSLSDLE